jgi:hypothetical protein
VSEPGEQKFGFVAYAMERLFAVDAPYSANEIVVVLAVVRHMNARTLESWPSYPRLAKQTRLSTKTIERTLAKHCNESPAPLIERRWASHKTYTFRLVRDPEAFAKARDAQPKRPKRTRPTPPPRLKAPLIGPPPEPQRRRAADRARIVNKPYTMAKCRCGTLMVIRNGIATNYDGDAIHECRFVEAGKTESLTNTSDGPEAWSEPASVGTLAQIGLKVGCR